MLALSSLLNIVSVFFLIISIRFLSSPKIARLGNQLAILGISFALTASFITLNISSYWKVLTIISFGSIVGIIWALKVKITSLPQMVAALNGLGGLAAFFIGLSDFFSKYHNYINSSLNTILGGITFSASLIAFLKLQGIIKSKFTSFSLQHSFNFIIFLLLMGISFCYTLHQHIQLYPLIVFLSLFFGTIFVLPIGGADMPVVISFLNSLSGWATVSVGFSFNNILLIIIGTIIGASGFILTRIMIKSMNRSLLNIFFGKSSSDISSSENSNKIATVGSPSDAAFIMENSQKIIIIPGYGMAASQAQYALKNMSEILKNKFSVDVRYAIHPVAGRMPGHMNVLLAEANVDYSDVFGINDINNDFSSTDVAFVIGANDITNPLANTDASSPIFGMPVFNVNKAKTVFFVKRSLGKGYSDIDNPLFYAPNTIMLLGDAKEVVEQIVKDLESN